MSNEYDTLAQADDYDALIAKDVELQLPRQQLRASLVAAQQQNPDEYGRAKQLERRTGLPAPVVARNLPAVEQAANLNEYDSLLETSPVLARQLQDPDFAAMSHDDAATLRSIENRTAYGLIGGPAFRRDYDRLAPTPQPEVSVSTLLRGLGTAFTEGATRTKLGTRLELLDATDSGDVESEVLRNDTIRKFLASQSRQTDARPGFATSTGSGLYSGAESLVQQTPGFALSLVTRSSIPSLAQAYAQVQAEAYGKYRGRGATPGEAFAGATGEGAVEVATEMLPLRTLLGAFGKPGRTAAVEFLKSQVQEQIGEQAATFLQDAIDTAIANPDKTWADFAAERPDAAYQTFLATLMQSGLLGAGHVTMSKLTQADAAEQDAATLQQLAELAKASKVLQRDPQTFEQFVNAAAEGGPVQDIYIDARTLQQAAGEALPLIMQASPSVAAQFNEAVQTGGDIRIPLGEYASTLAAGDTNALLQPHLRTAPDALSMNEAQTLMQSQVEQFQAEAEKLASEKEFDSGWKQSVATVEQELAAQLNATGRFTDDVNNAYAKLMAAFYSVTANRLGMTPEQMYVKYPLQIRAEGLTGGRVMDQNTAQAEGAFGPIRHEFRHDAQGAIAALKESRTGEAIGALHHPDIGDIDLVWGEEGTGASDGYGLAKLVKYHPEVLDDLQGILSSMQVVSRSANRVNLESPDHRAGVRLTWDGQAKHWLMTAFEKRKGSVTDTTTDTADVARMDDTARQSDASDAIVEQKLNDYYQGVRGQISFGKDITETPSILTLLKHADLSTFLHEMGHFQLEVLTDIASQPDAPADVVADVEKLLKWFGIQGEGAALDPVETLKALTPDRSYSPEELLAIDAAVAGSGSARNEANALRSSIPDLDTPMLAKIIDSLRTKAAARTPLEVWRAMSFEARRPYHEQFARGFEAYLFEGKSPSVELNGLFARFRAWLINVYRSLKSLNVELSDEVRGVMDRLVATNEEIIAAEAQRSYRQLFTEKPEGIDDAEWAEYQRLGIEATQTAVEDLGARTLRDMQWLTKAKGAKLRELQRENKAKRVAVEAEVTAEVRREPVYAAMRFLSRGELPNVEELTNQQRKALDTTAGASTKLDLGALKEMYGDGPAAPWRYLPTGKYGLATAQDGMHPDLAAELFGFTSGDHLVRALLDAQPEEVVIEGMTDTRMLERYGDLTDQRAIDRAVNEAIRNDVRARFAATEYKFAAKAAGPVRAIAAAAKEFAAKSLATKRLRDIKPSQFEAAEGKAQRAAEKARGKDDAGFVTATRDKMLNNALAREAYRATAEIEKGARYLKRVVESETIDAEYKDQIAALLDRFDLRKISNTEADRRKSLLEWIESQKDKGYEPVIDPVMLNEAQRKPYREMTLEEFRGLVDTVKNIEHLGRLKHKLLTAKDAREFAERVGEAERSIIENAKREIPQKLESNTFKDRLRKGVTEFFVMHRKLHNMLRELDGWNDGGVMWELLGRPMNEAGDAEAVMREEATVRLSDLFEPILKAGKLREKTYIPAIKASLSREGRIVVALNTGNEGNLQRLMDGDRWTQAQVKAITDTLTKEEWDFVQGVWDFLDSYRQQIGAQQKRLTGVEPEWVQPMPVDTPHGTYRGGYFPAKYDTDRSSRSLADEAAANIMDQWRAARNKPKTRDGFTKARADAVVNRPLRKDFGVLTQHITEVTHRLAWQDFLTDATRLLAAGPIDGAIRDHYGPEILKSMRDAVKDIAAGEVGAQNAFESAINYLRSGATVAGLGWRLTTSLLQPIGLTQSMVRIGPKYVAKGLAEWLGDAAKMENTAKRIYDKSNMMRLRAKTMQREISEIRNKVAGRTSAIEASYFYLIQKMQLVADIPTWLGQYTKAIEHGADEATAIAQADQAVIDAQGAGQVKDLAAIQRGGPMLKLFTNFYSFFNTTYNLTKESVGRTKFNNPASVGRLAVDMLLLYSVPAAMGTLLKFALQGGGDEDELRRRLIADQLNYLFGTMVGLRELAGGVQAASGLPGDYQGPAGVRFFTEVAKLAKQTGQGEVDEAFLKSLDNVGGILFHYPSGQINSTASGIAALAEGRTDNPAALLVGPPPNR